MRDRFFNWLACVAINRPWTVLSIAGGIFVVSAGVSSLVKPAMGWMDMLPQDEPAVMEFAKILDDFGATEVMTASVEGPDPDELVAFAGKLETRLLGMKDDEGNALIQRVTWREDADYFLDHGLMLAKAKDLQRLIDSGVWDEPGLLSAVGAQNRDFKKEYVDDDGGSLEKKEAEATVAIDTMWWLPRTLRSFIEQQSKASDDDLRPEVELGARRYVSGDLRYFSDDRSILLLQIQPTFNTEDMERTLSTVGSMREIFDELVAQYPAIAANYPGPWPGKTLWDTPEVMITPPDKAHMGTGITGWHQYYYDETMTGFNDLGAGMIIAFLSVLALFIVAFRMWTSPLLAMAVLVMSITLATAFMALALGELTMMAMMIPIVLLGLGVDYAIHIVGEFTKRRHQGESVNDAMHASLHSTGKGILTGGVTTAVAFLALGFTSFRGLSDFGIGAGGGVLATVFTSFIVLPAALVVIHRRKERKAAAKGATGAEGSAGFFLDFAVLRISATMAYRAWPVTILIVAAITVYMGMHASDLKWAKDMLSVEAKGLASLTLNDVLEDRFYIHPDADMLTAGSLDEAYQLTEEIEDLSTVRMVQSITSFVPPESKQRARAPLVTAIRKKIDSWASAPAFDAVSAAAFAAALKQMDCNVITIGKSAFMSGMDRLYDKSKLLVPEGATCVERMPGQPRPEGGWPRVAASDDVKAITGWLEANPNEAAALLNRFQAIFEPARRASLERAANPEVVTLDILPESQRDRFLSKDGKRFLLTVYPRGDVWNEDFQNDHIPKMTGVSDRVTGTVMLFVATIERGAQEGRKATYLCFAVILVLLLLDFWGLRGRQQLGRGLLAGGLAIVPLVIAAIWMVGFMVIAGIDLNMANIIALPLILGIGIDDGVHIVHRYLYEKEGSDRMPRVLGTTGRAILLTSLTTIAAFGSFALGLYRGLVTMGIILAVGIAFCFVLSAYFLPALIRVVELLKVRL